MTLYFSPNSPMNQQKTSSSSTEEVFVLPTSFAQQRLWFLDQLQAGISFYNLSKVLRLNGRVNIAALQRSLTEIVHRHEVLRTTFLTVEGQPMQVITPQFTFTLPVVDLQTQPVAQQQVEVKRLASEEVQLAFNLAQGSLLRTKLLQLSSQEYVFILTMHHIVSDGWSIDVLIQELTTLYQAFCNGNTSPIPPLPIQYADFAVWQRQWLQGDILESQLSYWKQQLNGAPPILQLISTRPRPPIQSFRGATKLFELPPHLSQALKNLSRQEGVTLFMTLLTAFKVLLYRYTGQEDIIVGSPIAGRNRKELEGLIGFFINNLVLRTDLSGNPSFKELLQRVREVTLGAYAHQDLPFEKLVEELQPVRDLSYNPLFQVAFVLQNTPMTTIKLSGVTIHPLEVEDINTVQFDLVLSIQETEQGLAGALMYSTDLFDAAIITWMLKYLQTLLEDIVAHPTKHISHLLLLDELEQKQLLVEWNNTQTEYPQHQLIHELFEIQVEKTPDAVAIVCEQQQLSYGELNARANQLAHYLKGFGVGPEVLVGICIERSLEMVIGLLGILKAGGAYVPLDPTYPQERLAFMLEDSQLPILLTQKQLIDKLPLYRTQVVCLDADWEMIAQEPDKNQNSRVTINNVVYTIYTSGSTGQPKGVQIQHQGLLNLIFWHQRTFTVSQIDRATQVAKSAFDASVWELWPYLTVGASIHIVDEETCVSPWCLCDWFVSQAITISFLPTPLAESILLLDCFKKLTLRTLLTGGDKLHSYSLPSLPFEFVNNYGPTENTVVTTSSLVTFKKQTDIEPVIGHPISNTQVYLLDPYLQPLPIGIPGELYIGGDSLARGYLNQPALTSEKFIPNPFSKKPGERLYKTGDLGRYLPDGNIEYIGRIDLQVKIRGFRIELGEIETILVQHPQVQKSVVVAREDAAGDKRLVAYVVTDQESPSISHLRRFLQQRLPDYMVPSAFVFLKALPLTPNGKVDRNALPVPDSIRPELERILVPPQTVTQETMAKIWQEVLSFQPISIHDNFFEIGGHSLLATQLISRLRKTFHIELPLRYLFEAPTIATLSKHIEATNNENQNQQLLSIKIAPRNEKLPLSFAQQRLWFLDQLEENNYKYNISAALKLNGSLYIKSLEQSLNEIIKRHEVLRTTFITVDDEPIQVINSTSTFTLSRVDLSELPKTEQDVIVTQLAIEESKRPFNLSIGPLLRTTLLQVHSTEYILLLTMHHIVSDGWSIGVFIREIMTFYEAFCTGKVSSLPEPVIQYADFAIWQRQWLQGDILEAHLSYWKQQLGNNLSILQLPTDYPRPAVQTFQGTTQSFTLSQALSDSLRSLSHKEGVTLFMTLLAAFKILLCWYTTQDDIIVGTDVANRNRVETEDLIGFFVNQLVLRTNLSGNPTYLELLKRVREITLQAYAHQDLPFEKLVEVLKPERDLSRNPLFQVMFSFLNTPMPDLELLGLTISPLKIDSGTTVFDISLYIIDTEQELIGLLRYNTDLFRSDTMNKLIEHFQTLLNAIIIQPNTQLNILKEILVEADFQRRSAKHKEFRASRSRKLKSIKPKPISGLQ
ncbi:non-ribosomal peptide synthetase [Nostocales cyanobacterium HT-58-2]|nr:non-ribosomal peptide synthetase [Nostocales cyanobacterium HT-58-2]